MSGCWEPHGANRRRDAGRVDRPVRADAGSGECHTAAVLVLELSGTKAVWVMAVSD